jgi:hypothetical protein
MIENPLEQLELQFLYGSRTEVSLSFPGGVRKITVEYGKIENVSVFCNHIVLRNCIVHHLQDCPPFRKLEFRDCAVDEGDLSSLTILEEAFFSPSHPTNLYTLADLKYLKLKDSLSVTDVSCLRNVPKLEFVGCPMIRDVSGLTDVHELSFIKCHGITDVSSLGSVHKLKFSFCDNIRDVFALGNVHILAIAYCPGVSDVSALGNVYELHLIHCNQIRDISALRNVKEMHLWDFSGTDVSGLEKVERLFLSGFCPGITDIWMLKRIQVLDVHGWVPRLVSSQWFGFGKLRDLRFRSENASPSSTKLFNFSILECLSAFKSLNVDFSAAEGESTATTVSLNNLYKLTLQYANNISKLLTNRTLSHLRSLSLSYCGDFTFLPELPSLGYLDIECCNQLINLHLFVGEDDEAKFPIYSVTIRYCSLLEEVKVTRKVSDMKISFCDQLIRITAQSQIDRLRTDHCERLNIQSGNSDESCLDARDKR